MWGDVNIVHTAPITFTTLVMSRVTSIVPTAIVMIRYQRLFQTVCAELLLMGRLQALDLVM